MSRFKKWLMAGMMAMSLGGTLITSAIPQTVSAADCNRGFLGFPAWYRGLTNAGCQIVSPDAVGGLPRFISVIGLNVVEIVLIAISYVAAFYLLYGGFLFIISRGKPEDAAKARITMLNAVIGLLISIAAIAVVNFIIFGIVG